MELSGAAGVKADKREKRFYSIDEAAELLGLSYSTLYRAIRADEFPAIKVRGRYVVPARAIDDLESTALDAVRV
jgi:excisionase family DNA binding protein